MSREVIMECKVISPCGKYKIHFVCNTAKMMSITLQLNHLILLGADTSERNFEMMTDTQEPIHNSNDRIVSNCEANKSLGQIANAVWECTLCPEHVTNLTRAAGVTKTFESFAEMVYLALIGGTRCVSFLVETITERKRRIFSYDSHHQELINDSRLANNSSNAINAVSDVHDNDNIQSTIYFTIDYNVEFTRAIFPIPLTYTASVETNMLVEEETVSTDINSHTDQRNDNHYCVNSNGKNEVANGNLYYNNDVDKRENGVAAASSLQSVANNLEINNTTNTFTASLPQSPKELETSLLLPQKKQLNDNLLQNLSSDNLPLHYSEQREATTKEINSREHNLETNDKLDNKISSKKEEQGSKSLQRISDGVNTVGKVVNDDLIALPQHVIAEVKKLKQKIVEMETENERLICENDALRRLSKEKMIEMQKLCELFENRVDTDTEIHRLRTKNAQLRLKLEDAEVALAQTKEKAARSSAQFNRTSIIHRLPKRATISNNNPGNSSNKNNCDAKNNNNNNNDNNNSNNIFNSKQYKQGKRKIWSENDTQVSLKHNNRFNTPNRQTRIMTSATRRQSVRAHERTRTRFDTPSTHTEYCRYECNKSSNSHTNNRRITNQNVNYNDQYGRRECNMHQSSARHIREPVRRYSSSSNVSVKSTISMPSSSLHYRKEEVEFGVNKIKEAEEQLARKYRKISHSEHHDDDDDENCENAVERRRDRLRKSSRSRSSSIPYRITNNKSNRSRLFESFHTEQKTSARSMSSSQRSDTSYNRLYNTPTESSRRRAVSPYEMPSTASNKRSVFY